MPASVNSVSAVQWDAGQPEEKTCHSTGIGGSFIIPERGNVPCGTHREIEDRQTLQATWTDWKAIDVIFEHV